MDANCLRCRQLLSAAMDGEATPQEIAFVRQHMTTCPDCREAQAAYNNLRSRFQTLPQPLPPPQLRMAVMSRLNGDARAIPLGRKPVAGLSPFLSLGQKLTVVAMAAVILVLGGLVVLSVLRSPAFEVIDQQADLTDQKVLMTFSQPVDATYIMANPQLFEIKNDQGQSIPITKDDIKVQNDGKTVEIDLPQGVLKPDDKKIEVNVKPDVKAQDGKTIKNPGPKEATVLPVKATPTLRPATSTPKPSATSVPNTATPVQTTPPATTPGVTTAPVIIPPATTVAPSTTAPPTTRRPTTAPATTPPATTVVLTTTVVPTTTIVATTQPPPQTTPPPATTVVPTTTVAPVTTVAPITTTIATPTTATVPATSDTTPAVTTVVSSPSPTLRSEACKVTLRRDFGKLYNERAEVGSKIGCPTLEEAQASLSYQAFQRGFMLLHRQTGSIYVFYNNGSWERLSDPGSATPGGSPTPSAATGCASVPGRSFGNVWTATPGVRAALGCPLGSEGATTGAAFQSFDRGAMFFNPIAANGRRVYVLYNDSTYLDAVDTF